MSLADKVERQSCSSYSSSRMTSLRVFLNLWIIADYMKLNQRKYSKKFIKSIYVIVIEN